jgi:hypothetical protein
MPHGFIKKGLDGPMVQRGSPGKKGQHYAKRMGQSIFERESNDLFACGLKTACVSLVSYTFQVTNALQTTRAKAVTAIP